MAKIRELKAPATAGAPIDPIAARTAMMAKSAAIESAFRTTGGTSKIAAALLNPVKKHLDYVAINRRIIVPEMIPEGAIAYYDSDIAEFSGVRVGRDGVSRKIICEAVRTTVEPFEIWAKPKVPYRELRTRKYKVLDRTKERLKQGMGIREDLILLALLHDAAVTTNTQYTTAGYLSKSILARATQEVEKHRLFAASLIINPQGISGIRRWDWQTIDELARTEIRRTGYIGNIWGANIFITNLITVDSLNRTFGYVTAAPQFLGWLPIYADSEVIPADLPDQGLLGFNGYDLLGMLVHNSFAVARVVFSAVA